MGDHHGAAHAKRVAHDYYFNRIVIDVYSNMIAVDRDPVIASLVQCWAAARIFYFIPCTRENKLHVCVSALKKLKKEASKRTNTHGK